MKAVILKKATGADALTYTDMPEPELGECDVMVRMRAAALNWRDLLIFKGGYRSQQKMDNLVPLTDGAGEVVQVGKSVTRWKVGDRVIANFCPNWIGGKPSKEALSSPDGKTRNGMLCELKTFREHELVRTPDHLTNEEAAAIPCAGITAWNALITLGQLRPGDVLLTQGTGGVSLFALQIAKMVGAEIIVTSSTDEKLERAKELGADHTVNYSTTPEWSADALKITNGRGVDHVMELGGTQTLKQSLMSVCPGGTINMIGVLSGAKFGDLLLPFVVSRQVRLQGVTVGSRQDLEALCKAMTVHQMHPVIDSSFPMEKTLDAVRHLESGKHYGKVCISI